MKKNVLRSLLFFCFVLSGCVSTITTRSVIQDYMEPFETKNTIDAITYVLSNNGFDVKTINEKFGLVTTDWRSLNTSGSAANVFLTVLTASRYSATTYNDSLQLTFQITENGYTVIPKTMRTSSTSNAWSHTSSNSDADYPTADSVGGKLTVKVMKEINELLGIDSDFRWEEKEITVE